MLHVQGAPNTRSPVWLAIAGAGLLIAHQVLERYFKPVYLPPVFGRFVTTECGMIGLTLLLTAGLFWLVNKAHKQTVEGPSTLLIRGALFGMAASMIVGLAFQPPPAPAGTPSDLAWIILIYRFQRLLSFSALMGGGMYLMLHLVTDMTKTSMVSHIEQIGAMAIGLCAVFFCGLWAALELPRVGIALCSLSFGVIDWIGSGILDSDRCQSNPLSSSSLSPRGDIPEIAAAMLGWYFFFVTIWESNSWRLSFPRTISIIAGSIVAGFVLYHVVAELNPTAQASPPSGSASGLLDGALLAPMSPLKKFGPFLIGMMLYAVLFCYWVTWSRHHALVEALCKAYGSTDQFRAMVDARLKPNFDVPPRGGSLFTDVCGVVDRAESNGWINSLLVHARRSRPEDLRLAKLADTFRVGIEPPAAANISKTIDVIRKIDGPASAGAAAGSKNTSDAFEAIIRKFNTLPLDERRLREARLEARVCRVITPRNEGTGWLVGPDLVLTNYHVVEALAGDHAPFRGSDVVCQFDYKESSGVVIKGAECRLSNTKPVAEFSRYSAFDRTNSEDLPSPTELDFALLRLERPMGREAIGGVGEIGAPMRGWIPLKHLMDAPDPDAGVLDEKMILYVLQHPYGGPLKAECGEVLTINANGTRVQHDATTDHGSSGSPCFNFADLEPFALHHAGKHSNTLNKTVNQAIPITRILHFIRDRKNVEPFWDEPLGGPEKPLARRGHA